ncbi:hypothetical protein GPUN_0603 [Glaciecola punicea ACAM 611]|uniref:Uncharacterized protein n=1 Tax=Glaciecola punicea ACAM 611 TaxID=1121923 RepID=H5T8X0_9ALTE|nr:hypothetical protein GPUN_0603 [Glaciecola punicea ACAM 611]
MLSFKGINKKRRLLNIDALYMAGVAGLEPTNDGIKTRCLTNLAIPQKS